MVTPNLERMKNQLDALKNNQSTSSSGADSVFWKVEPGDHDIRLLTYEDGEIMREFHWHYNVNGNRYLCAKKSFGKECPVCDLATEVWNSYVETEQAGSPDDSLKEMAKNLFASKRYYVPVLVREMEDEGPKLYSCGVRAMEQILAIAVDEESKNMFDPNKGFDLKLTYNLSNPKDRRTATTTINARRSTSPLFTDGAMTPEAIEEFQATVPDPREVFDLPDIDDIRENLDTIFGAMESDTSSGTNKYSDDSQNDEDEASAVLKAFQGLGSD